MSTSPARIRRHSSARSPSPRPEWTSATRASRSARSRSTSGSASAISGTSTSAGRPRSQRRGDRLDVDRGLAAARHAVEQERASGRRAATAARDQRRPPRPARAAGRSGGPAAAQPDRPTGERPARPLADRRPRARPRRDEAGHAPTPVAGRPASAPAQPAGGVRAELLEQRGQLPRSERPARPTLAGRQRRAATSRRPRSARIQRS